MEVVSQTPALATSCKETGAAATGQMLQKKRSSSNVMTSHKTHLRTPEQPSAKRRSKRRPAALQASEADSLTEVQALHCTPDPSFPVLAWVSELLWRVGSSHPGLPLHFTSFYCLPTMGRFLALPAMGSVHARMGAVNEPKGVQLVQSVPALSHEQNVQYPPTSRNL